MESLLFFFEVELIMCGWRAHPTSPPLSRWRKYPFASRVAFEPRTVTIYARMLGSGGGAGVGRPSGVKSVFQGLDGEPCTVEERALQFYASEVGRVPIDRIASCQAAIDPGVDCRPAGAGGADTARTAPGRPCLAS